MSFLTQLSFPVSKKHGKCAFGALGPAPAHMAAAHPVALSSALQRGVTTHHEVCPDFFSPGTADLLLTSSQTAFTPALSPFPCCSLCPFIIPFFPLWPSLPQVFPAYPSSTPSPSPSLTSLPHHSLVPPYLIHPDCVCPSSLFLSSFSTFLLHLPLLPSSLPGRASSSKAG